MNPEQKDFKKHGSLILSPLTPHEETFNVISHTEVIGENGDDVAVFALEKDKFFINMIGNGEGVWDTGHSIYLTRPRFYSLMATMILYCERNNIDFDKEMCAIADRGGFINIDLS